MHISLEKNSPKKQLILYILSDCKQTDQQQCGVSNINKSCVRDKTGFYWQLLHFEIYKATAHAKAIKRLEYIIVFSCNWKL